MIHRQRGPRAQALRFTFLESPFGPVLVAGTEAGVSLLSFTEGEKAIVPGSAWRECPESFRRAKEQLSAYFAGELTHFDLELHLAGTPFQLRVWRELRKVPYGRTVSYTELARAIGNPRAVRAVGAANGANPIPVVIPCHRVVGAHGALVGYRGGIGLKRRLLELEGASSLPRR